MKALVTILILGILTLRSESQVTAQWRGPDRSGGYPETGLLREWPAGGPALLWSASDIGKGYSSAVCDGKKVYVTGMQNDMDILTAIDEKGTILWQLPYGASWSGTHPDTRCTPAVDNGSVYVLSGSGTIACIDANEGKVKWSVDALKKFEGEHSTHGPCESLLVSGEKLFYTPGGPRTTLVALDKNTGETIWASESLNDVSAYVSPLQTDYAGRNMVITLLSNHLLGVDAGSGKILWKYDFASLNSQACDKIWYASPKINTVTPLFSDGFIYVTGGYNHGGAMFRLSDDASSISLVWTDSTLDCHHGGVVLVNGIIFGSNWISNNKGDWCGIDWKTGRPFYSVKWIGKGSVISADNMLYCYEEKSGNVGLVRPDTLGFGLVSSFKVPLGDGPYWAHPSISEGILYVRHGRVLMAYDIRKR